MEVTLFKIKAGWGTGQTKVPAYPSLSRSRLNKGIRLRQTDAQFPKRRTVATSIKGNPSRIKIGDNDYFRGGLGPAISDLMEGFLDHFNERLPSHQVALYGLQRGHLSFLMSHGNCESCQFVGKVSYLQVQKQLEQDALFDNELIVRSFFKARPNFHTLVLPMKIEKEVKGAIVVLREEAEVPSRQVFESLRSWLLSIAALISSAELVNRERMRSSRLSVINRIIRSIDVLVEEKQLYKHIVASIQRHFQYDHVAIYSLDREGGVFVLKALAGKFGKVIPRNQTIPLGQGIVSWVVTHDKTLLSNNVHKNPFFLNWTPDLITTEAELCVPIHVDKQVIGVLNIEHGESLYFDQDDTNAIELLADRIGVAINNSRLYSELNRSYTQLQEIVSSMGQGLMIVDRDLRVRWANEAVQRWGVSPLNGGSFLDLFGSNSSKVKDDLVKATLNDGVMRRELIKGENDRYFLLITAPVLDGARLRAKVLIVIDDVTAGMRSQAQLEKSKQEIETLQRLNALGELASFIAHEIRNPLNAMTQAADLLETDANVSGVQTKLLKVLKEETKSLNDILSSHLQRARPPEPQFVLWDLRSIIEQVMSLLESDRSLMERIDFKVDIQESVPPVSLDANATKQLFLNLLLNSTEAINGGGKITVTVRRGDKSVLVQISDSGCGIPKGSLPYLFKPFFTTKDKGTGLGLAVVKRIVDEHGWDIRIESKESKGTDVVITVPLETEEC